MSLIASLGALSALCKIGVNHASMGLNQDRYYRFSYVLLFIAAMEFIKNSSSALMKVFCYIGVLSYPIYLLHQDVGYIIIGAGGGVFLKS